MTNLTIKEIELVNFMCHDNLKISFEKLITCIGGRNGSGKSAVMIALGILFGQRANSLERGNGYSNLIKTGTNQSIIKVTLNNHLKYKTERYGDKIIIEKKLKLSSSSMSIYNYNGKIFNIKKNELESIIEKYGLKFDNPLNFLTQEKSKKFLNVTKAEDLYDFYYHATEFKNIEEELEESKALLGEMKDKIDEIDRSKNILEQKLLIEEKNFNFLKFDADLALENLEIEEKWGEINYLENRVAELNKLIQNSDKKILEKEEERKFLLPADQNSIKYESTNENEDNISKLKIQIHDVTTELNEFCSKKNEITDQLENIKKRGEMGSLEQELKELKNFRNKNLEELNLLENEKESIIETYENEKATNQENEEKSNILRKQISFLKQHAFDSYKEKHMENFKNIENEMRKIQFKDKVIGPVSRYLRLKENEWFKVASIVLKSSLMNYIVFNSEDKIKLHGIFKRLGVEYSVSQMRSKVPYKNLKINNDFKTLYSVLVIENPIISNHLITVNNIEQIILIENRTTAYKVIKKDPRNVESAYIPSGDKIKLYNGSLSDFKQRDDNVYWFEDKDSKLKKLELQYSQISIKDEATKRYKNLILQNSRLEAETDSLNKKIKYLEIQLDSFRNLKENDTEGLEKKLKILIKSIESFEKRQIQLNSEIIKEEDMKREIINRNKERSEEYNKKRMDFAKNSGKIDYEIMVIRNSKAVQIGELRDLQTKIEEKSKDIGIKPEFIRDIKDIEKERKSIHEFKLQARELRPKEEIEINIIRLNKEICELNELKMKYDEILKETMIACDKRIKKREEIKEKDSEQATRMFREYTMRSGYVGKMDIDHFNKKLDLKMQVHNSEFSGSKSTLSGGERSFAGVCFLLSMWKCFKCPVKIMDEFDVFMDSLNRKMAINCLLEFFKENKTQVILITPLDTSDLNDSECDIKILRKEDRNDE